MTKDWEAICYSHRQHPLHARLAEAWFRHVPQTCRLTIIREPGTAAQNSNRALDMAKARYLFLLDEDAILCQDGWIESMLEMTKLPDFGIGGCLSVPNAEAAAKRPGSADQSGPFVRVNGMSGYVFLLDLQRLRGIRFDEEIPGDKSMSDVDLCVQARVRRGLGVYQNDGAIVIHQEKPRLAGARLAVGFSTVEQEDGEWWPAQCRYMDAKWGLNKWSNRS